MKKTFTIEATPEQLMVLSQALMAYENMANQAGVRAELCDDNKAYKEAFWKVSDALNEYYEIMGIKD